MLWLFLSEECGAGGDSLFCRYHVTKEVEMIGRSVATECVLS